MRRIVAGGVLAALFAVVVPAWADPPGPGDKQCVPGMNGQPQPGAKGGTCPPLGK